MTRDSATARPAFSDDRLDGLAALAMVLDIANGFLEDKSVLAALFAAELASAIDAPDEVATSAFYATLLRHLGCTGYARREAELVEDDIALRSALHRTDDADPLAVARTITMGAGSFKKGAATLARLASGQLDRDLFAREVCGAARTLASALGVDPAVELALETVYERWDGRGAPHGLQGEALPLISRLATTAHLATMFWMDDEVTVACARLREREGAALDPTLASIARASLEGFAHRVTEDRAQVIREVERTIGDRLPACSIEALATVFGDFSDLQCGFTRGHSRHVADLASAVARELSLGEKDARELRLASHLHDVAAVAVPTAIWERTRAFAPSERERARTHAYYAERVLETARAFQPLAAIAGAHHERLDGSGYHRGLRGAAIGVPARILAAADVAAALASARPHRAALSKHDAARELRKMADDGALDAAVVEALLASLGMRARGEAAGARASLTPREVEVIRGVARGLTNKEISVALSISSRTVQSHTIHAYAKLGVDTRAGAAIAAARLGLLDLDVP